MSEDPHERELDEIEKEIEELESADKQSDDTKPENGKQDDNLKVEEDTAGKTYEEKSKDTFERNPHTKETRLSIDIGEITIEEEDL